MGTQLFEPPQTEFYNRFPENYLPVENQEGGCVIIRAALDNYSDRRKALFIHELASEGFIPNEYQFMTNSDEGSYLGDRWVIDGSWLIVPPEVIATSQRRALALVLGVFVVAMAVVVWLIIRSPS